MSALDLRRLTMDDAAALLGLRKPVHHRQRLCATCGSADIVWAEEYRGCSNDPDGWTGYEVEYCQACDAATGVRRWVGF